MCIRLDTVEYHSVTDRQTGLLQQYCALHAQHAEARYMHVKQACAANRRYSMRRRKCKQNKRYRTSARITKVLPGTGRTDRRTDRVQRNMRHPPTEEGAA